MRSAVSLRNAATLGGSSLAEALSIVVVELALAGGAEFLYHLFEFGDLFERARTEFELVCRISTFARREGFVVSALVRCRPALAEFGLPRFEVLVAQAVEQAASSWW